MNLNFGAGDGIRTRDVLLGRQRNVAKVLNKLTVSELAELSNLSKAYISQVKSGKRPPSQKLLDSLWQETKNTKTEPDYLQLFLASRESMGVSPRTLEVYIERLSQFILKVDYLKANRSNIEKYLSTIPPNKNGLATRHCSYRTIKTLYRWLNNEYKLSNPMVGIPAPILGKPIMPSLEQAQVLHLIEEAPTLRDQAIIALFVESGLRLVELTSIRREDVNWKNRTVRTLGKGKKESYAPFGSLSEKCLKDWLKSFQTENGNIWV